MSAMFYSGGLPSYLYLFSVSKFALFVRFCYVLSFFPDVSVKFQFLAARYYLYCRFCAMSCSFFFGLVLVLSALFF